MDSLNTNTNKSKGYMMQVERKRKDQSTIASQKKQGTELETNLLIVQYSTISGVAEDSIGNNIITNFRHA